MRRYTHQILVGLDFLHCRGIVHNDIKVTLPLLSRHYISLFSCDCCLRTENTFSLPCFPVSAASERVVSPRDSQGGNILVTEEGVIKLADFNSSKQLGNLAGGGSNPLRSLLGTPHFMAPVVIRQTGHGKKVRPPPPLPFPSY